MAKEHFTTIEVKSTNGFTYKQFDNIKDSSILKESHIGKRVLVAGFKVTKKFYLKKVHYAGEPGYPENSYTLTTDRGTTRCFHEKCCRLHPAEYRKGKRWKR